MARNSTVVEETVDPAPEATEATVSDSTNGDSTVERPRLPEPKRADVGISFTEIPTTTRTGYWATQKEFLLEHPGEYFLYENTGASQVTQIRRRYGLDAVGKNHRKVNRDTGEVVGKDESGSEVVDVYVAYRPDLEDYLTRGIDVSDEMRRGDFSNAPSL